MSSKIEKLNHTSFHAWRHKIIHLLTLKDLEEYVSGSPPESQAELAACKTEDRQAQPIIGLPLSDHMLENARDVSTSNEMWKTICDVFERHPLLNELSARRKFYTATPHKGERARPAVLRPYSPAGCDTQVHASRPRSKRNQHGAPRPAAASMRLTDMRTRCSSRRRRHAQARLRRVSCTARRAADRPPHESSCCESRVKLLREPSQAVARAESSCCES